MKWNVNDIYNFVKLLARKNQSASISAGDLFYAWNGEQSSLFEDLKGRWQKNNNGKTGMNTGLNLTQTILTELTPFTENVSLTIVSGVVTKPTDFAWELAMRKGNDNVEAITHGQISSVLKSTINPPSVVENKYYAVPYLNTYKLLPVSTTGTIDLDYLKQPQDINWGFVFDINNRQVYNSATSVQPQWSQSEIVLITKRTLATFGVSFKDRDFESFGNKAQETGK